MPKIDKNNVLEILGEKVMPGKGATINFNMAKLYTTTSVEVPVIIERSKTRPRSAFNSRHPRR